MPLVSSAARPQPTTARAASSLRLRLLLCLYAVLPVLVVGALGAYGLYTSREQYEERARLLTQNLALALDRSVSANIEKIDLALSAIADHLEGQLARGGLDMAAAHTHIQSQIARRSELEGLRVTDAQGTGILGPTLHSQPQFSFADREWFTVQRDRPDAGLHLSQPLVSKVAGNWIVSLSRRYRWPNGEFAGAVSAAVPLAYLKSELMALDVGPRGTVTLRDTQFRLVVRHPQAAEASANVVGSQKISPELRQLVLDGNARGTVHAQCTADGVERTLSFRRLQVVPLLVIVGVATEDYLAGWHSELRTSIFVGLGLLLMYGAGLAFLLHVLVQNKQARQRIELLAQAFEHSGEGIVITDGHTRIVEANPAYVEQSGYAPAELVGHKLALLASPRSTPAERSTLWRTLRDTGRWRGELWDRAKDGSDHPKWVSISVVRGDGDEVLHYVASSVDISEVKAAEDKILHLAHHDTLTQLPNRVFLIGRLQQAMADARREGTEVAMLFIDMDRFKNINDTLGHHVGDGLLVQVGQRLRGLVRESDIVARLGGDEFVLVLTGIAQSSTLHSAQDTPRVAAAMAGRVLAALGEPYFVDGHELHSTPSIGIGAFPHDGTDPDTLMKNADAAMYHAKSAGRNNFQFFTAAMNQASAERLQLEVGLRGAIERGELFLHYQPQVDVASSQVVGLEALLRWRHPELGLVPPLKFITIAEDTGQIEAIGAWVLEQALAQVARWRAAHWPTLRVAVNLSAQQLRTDGFVPLVARALQRHGLSGEALELEITESVAMRDPVRTGEMLRGLRSHGVALAIDDFGTGHSSLAYLKQLPLSCLKLDRSFVMDIEHDANDAAICTATIQMAHSLGLGVVAEGVETALQLEFLRRLGCDTVQGYFFSKPLSVDDCTAFLLEYAMEAVAA